MQKHGDFQSLRCECLDPAWNLLDFSTGFAYNERQEKVEPLKTASQLNWPLKNDRSSFVGSERSFLYVFDQNHCNDPYERKHHCQHFKIWHAIALLSGLFPQIGRPSFFRKADRFRHLVLVLGLLYNVSGFHTSNGQGSFLFAHFGGHIFGRIFCHS